MAASRGRWRVGQRRPSRACLFTEPNRSSDLGNRRLEDGGDTGRGGNLLKIGSESRFPPLCCVDFRQQNVSVLKVIRFFFLWGSNLYVEKDNGL